MPDNDLSQAYGPELELIVVAVKTTALRCRILPGRQIVIFRPLGGVRQEAEGEILRSSNQNLVGEMAADIGHVRLRLHKLRGYNLADPANWGKIRAPERTGNNCGSKTEKIV